MVLGVGGLGFVGDLCGCLYLYYGLFNIVAQGICMFWTIWKLCALHGGCDLLLAFGGIFVGDYVRSLIVFLGEMCIVVMWVGGFR